MSNTTENNQSLRDQDEPWPDGLHYGRRLSYDSHLCSVRWYGSLPGTTGKWLGVEWDDSSRGKHNGSFKGKSIFKCLYSDNAGSFIRPDRKADAERNVLQAVRHKYEQQGREGEQQGQDVVVISGKIAEEVGFDKIAQQQAQLANLKIVFIDHMVVSDAQLKPELLQEFAQKCPNIGDLDVGYNVISSWSAIARICRTLRKLKTLRASGLRFFNGFSFPEPLGKTSEIYLEDCSLSASDVQEFLAKPENLPDLHTLHLSGNGLSSFSPQNSSKVSGLESLKKLVLDNNAFRDLSCLQAIVDHFPNVEDVSLRWNVIDSLGYKENESMPQFPNVTTINLSNNAIIDYSFFDALPQILPSLQALRTTNNPLFDTKHAAADATRSADQSFYLLLARIPSLESLNYSTITAKDREEGELYYLSIAEEQLRHQFRGTAGPAANIAEAVHRLYPQYLRLTEKYDRPSVVEHIQSLAASGLSSFKTEKYPPGSLGARLVVARFREASTGIAVTMRLPSSLPVTQVMGLLVREPSFKQLLQPLQFIMTYESAEFDPVGPTAEGSTRSAVYGKKLTVQQKEDIWKQWGDWDADELVSKALEHAEQDQSLNEEAPQEKATRSEYWSEDGSILIRDGRQWKRREVLLSPYLKRPWGQLLDGANDVTIRIDRLAS